MKTFKKILKSMLLMMIATSPALGEVAVVVHPDSATANISVVQASALFLSKANKLPDGTRISPIYQQEGEAATQEFYSKIIKKNAAQLNAYWSRLIFTGKGKAPKKVLDDDEVIEVVSDDPSKIGYISGSSVSDAVKVILRIP